MRPYQNFYGSYNVGSGTTFGAFVDIGEANFGENCKVQSFVSIPPGWTFGNNVFIGPGVRFANDKYPKANDKWDLKKGIVEDDVSIGINSTILPVHIGKGATIGAGSVVTKDCEPGGVYYGNPATRQD